MRDWLPWLLAVGAAVLGAAGLLRRPGRPGTRPDGQRRPGRPTAPERGRGKRGAGQRGTGRRGSAQRHPNERGTTQRRPPVDGRPGPGEIWWADVPYEDASGSKVRPCLVLRAGRDSAAVLKITSQDKSGRSDYIQIPTRSWDPQADHDSYLDLSDPVHVSVDAFSNRAGICEPELWSWVSRMPHLRRSA